MLVTGLGLSLAVAPSAWLLGFDALSGSALLLLLATSAALAGVALRNRWFPESTGPDAWIRGGVLMLAVVVGTGFVLGAVGELRTGAYAVSAVVVAAAVWGVSRGAGAAPAATPSLASWPAVIVGLGAAWLTLIAAHGLLHSPYTAYDSLSYHLFFPARWLQDHRLSIIPTPFSDEAQAYAPANGELYFLWLMQPFHGDVLARVGQLPFLLLIGAALYALARRAGASAAMAFYPVIFAFASRPMAEQASGADVDLICWGLFLSAIYLGLTAAERDRRRDWILWGLCVGLQIGTKYVALVYLPVLLAMALVRGLRPRMAWALPSLVAFGAPWYLRNWFIAGSPIYPASLSLAGVTIAQGAYSRAAMRHSIFHTSDWGVFPVMAARAFGVSLAVVWLPLALGGAWRMATSRPRGPALALLVAPLVMVPLYWFSVPDNGDPRFLMPAALLALLPIAFLSKSQRPPWLLHALLAAAGVWVLVGSHAEIPGRTLSFMGGWRSLEGVVTPAHIVLVVVLGGLAGGAWMVLRRQGVWGPAAGVAVVGLATAGLVAYGQRACGAAPCEYLHLSSIYLRPTFYDGWDWVRTHVHGATIANTGNNVPYPLAGPRLDNRVRYVNIDRHLDWRFHDYARAARQRARPADPDALATPSGVLLPVDPTAVPVDAVRPRFERMRGSHDEWTANLTATGATYVFVSALSAYEIDDMAHNDGGFPVEDDWAAGDPQRFRLVYENPQVHVYSFEATR